MFSSTMQIQPSSPPKNPIIAAVLSLVLGGVGQLYIGQSKKGVILIVAAVLSWGLCLGWIVQIVSAIDAYMMADKLQQGEAIGDMQFFWDK